MADPPLMTKVNYSKSMEMFGIFTGKVNITLNMQIEHWEEIPQPTFTYLKNVVFTTCDSVINEYRSTDSELLGAEFVRNSITQDFDSSLGQSVKRSFTEVSSSCNLDSPPNKRFKNYTNTY